jgi:succinate-semialdehyde dehydrogenase/glutarate-semialdehyde dehydrogenase
VPTLVAGNVCLLKPASNVPMAGLEMEQIFAAAGFPPQVVQSLLVDAAGAAKLIEDPRIAGVSLTGSVPAGRHVGALAGAHIKKVVLELGGSDPFLVLDDADPDQAARLAVQARFMNGGQSCIAAKRLIVHSAAARPFTEKFLEHFHALKVGDPLAEETDIGPLARREFLGELAGQLDDAVRRGAAVILGPAAPPGKGYFFRPAVVTGVTAGMRVLQEEVFGPLAPILVVADQAGAVAAANATVFGLGAAIMSRDTERAERLAAELETGFVAINDLVKSDPRLPFGGVKDSGVGRELSRYGLCEFVNIKSVVVQR